MGTQTKTAKIDYFTKNLSSPTFFGINILNFQEMFLNIYFKNSVGRNFEKIEKKINNKNSFFLVFFVIIYFLL